MTGWGYAGVIGLVAIGLPFGCLLYWLLCETAGLNRGRQNRANRQGSWRTYYYCKGCGLMVRSKAEWVCDFDGTCPQCGLHGDHIDSLRVRIGRVVGGKMEWKDGK